MFEDIDRNDELEVDAINVCLFLGWVPFVIAWAHYNTAFTEWLVQTYFITFSVFINYPRWYEKRNLRKLWFWKAMVLVGLVLHPAILAAMWVVDASTKTQWHAAATMIFICTMAIILEFSILGKIFGYFRPVDKLADAPDSSC